jgi:tetratricopeptide (TPR) repeat protein
MTEQQIQAELERAVAEVRAQEARKRRWLMLALVAVVLLAVTLVGGAWLRLEAERDARRAQLNRDVNDALARVTALREQARAANVGGGGLTAQAREQAQRALALVESGPADAALMERVRQLQAELDEEEKDRALLGALDAARLAQAETVAGENRFAPERAVPRFREALRAYGLPVGEGEPTAVAARIRGRPKMIREAIVAALDEWDILAGEPKLGLVEPHREWLRAVLEAAEPDDGWTRRFRTARAEKEEARRRAALTALANDPDVARLPARTLTRLARLLDPADRAALLRRALRHNPADFWVIHELGIALQEMTPPGRDEAVRCLTAALALRPDSPGAHLNLGNALAGKGQLEEAIACYRQAIALDPKYALAHLHLGNALRRKGQVDEAIACYRKALDLQPDLEAAKKALEAASKEKSSPSKAKKE